MCGICGIYNYYSKQPVKESVIHSMSEQIIHRGPDDDGFYVSGTLGLGMRRLSIIDLDGGHQPIFNENRTIWIVFNGEIYNFPELRHELLAKGHIFRTRSDTETIIHAYEEWGLDTFSKLNGMFGTALWDSNKQRLILARDPFGIKPLYYSDSQGSLLFGSEIKAILAGSPEISRIVDFTALDQFLTYTFVPSPNTIFAGIKKLPPGFLLIASEQDGVNLKRFYKSVPSSPMMSERQWLESLSEKIETAVQRQMIADVPVGVMLSGGVDSAIVAALMRRFAGVPIHSFTVGFGESFSFDELKAARLSAKWIGTEHHEAVITADEYASFLPQSIWYLEEPIATASALAFYWICRLASETVKVVLTGQGADEPFAGYARHFGEYYGGMYRNLPHFLRKQILTPLIDHFPRNEQIKRAVHSLDIVDPLSRFTQIYSIFDRKSRRKLYRTGLGDCSDDISNEQIELLRNDVVHLDSLRQMLYIDARLSLPDNLLLYGDKMAMSVSLEARVPFLDLELMGFIENMPSRLKINGFSRKYLLRKVARSWISPKIIQRKKIGFTTPVDQWFGKKLRGYIGEQLLASNSACRNYFNPSVIDAMIHDHETGRHDYKRHLFTLLTFEIWHQQFISHNT